MRLTIGWLTIISFVLNLFLVGLGLYQYLDSVKKEETSKTMIRSWQNQAEGISNGLLQISQNPTLFSTTKDMSQAVNISAQSARALNEAISQQRFYSDEEVRKQKEQNTKDLKNFMDEIRKKTSDK